MLPYCFNCLLLPKWIGFCDVNYCFVWFSVFVLLLLRQTLVIVLLGSYGAADVEDELGGLDQNFVDFLAGGPARVDHESVLFKQVTPHMLADVRADRVEE